MAKLSRQVGSTSQLVDIFIQANNVTTGAGLGSLAFNTGSLIAYYHRNTASASVQIALATMTLGTWATGGFIVVDGTNMVGMYQLGIPNAALASGADSVVIMLSGAANMAPVVLEIELTAVNNQSTAFGLVIAKTTNITGFNDIAATAIVSAGAITTSSGAVSNVTTVGTLTTYTGNTPQTGDSYARLGAPAGASVSADIAAIKSDTGTILTDVNTGAGAIYTRLGAPAGASMSADIASVKSSVGAVTGAVGSVTGNVGGNVVGSTASVTGAVGSVTGNVGGNVVGSVASVTAAVNVNLAQTLNAARATDSLTDIQITLNDVFHCATGSVSARVDASSGTSVIYATAGSGTTLRTKNLTLINPPATVPDKAV